MPNEHSVTENRPTVAPAGCFLAERVVMEIAIRASAWQSAELDQRGDQLQRCRARAQVLEQLAHDLSDGTLDAWLRGAP